METVAASVSQCVDDGRAGVRGIPASDGRQGLSTPWNPGSGWIPAPTKAIRPVTSPFLLPHPCTISRTSGPEETGRRSLALALRSPYLMERHNPLPSKYLIEMRKPRRLTVDLKTWGELFLFHPASAFCPCPTPFPLPNICAPGGTKFIFN